MQLDVSRWLNAWAELPARWQWAGWGTLVCINITATTWFTWSSYRAESARLAAATAVASWSAPKPVAVPEAARDFTSTLPDPLPTDRIISLVDQATRQGGVILESIHISHEAPTTAKLGRTEVAMTWKGSYEATKAALVDLSSRLPQLSVRSLQMLPLESQADRRAVRTALVVSLWSAPIAPARDRVEGR